MIGISNKIWISNKTDGWELGQLIQDLGDGNFVVEGKDGIRKTLSRQDTHRTDPTHFEDLEDLSTMNHLHEGPLLDCLRRRFAHDKIYTTTGDVLISVNPYKKIPGLYDSPLGYLDTPEDGEIDKLASRPHVFKIANLALVELLYGKKSNYESTSARNQSIVVSGESGAGKTEASKYVMNFLIEADQEGKAPDGTKTNRSEAAQRLGDDIKRVLLESNIIFEAFGNAKTVRNDNSSRFGKYIKLQYSAENQIISAFTETFLLEKSRLMNVNAGERNYHVFYQFLRGNKNLGLAQRLHLKDPSQFKMLTDAAGNALPSTEDPLYPQLLKALSTLGSSDEEIEQLLSLLAALLHLGNVTCAVVGEGGSVEVPEESADVLQDVGHVRLNSPTMPLVQITELLGVPPEMFVSRVTTQRVKVSTRRSVTIKRLNEIDIMNNLAALIKWVYSCAFGWLIKKINFAHCSCSTDDTKAIKFIGILDIFGFEILQSNSFEQLCINFTNERLQQQFNEYVFDREQNIYREEGLDWTSIIYKDNQPVIDLIGKKPNGLLIILEEQGMLNRGAADEGALISAFNQTHGDKTKSPNYEKSRFGNDGKFTVKHFAGDVTYSITGFLDKNNDSLQEDLMELMVCSSNPFIQNAIVAVGLDQAGNEGEPGFIGEVNPDKVVKSAGNLSMSARADDSAKRVSTGVKPPVVEDAGRKMKATGRRTSLVAADGGGKKLATTVTVSFQFRSQLDILLLTLRATSPHYIKCVKPNALKAANNFDSLMVLEQLRYSGALEVVRIRQEGFPICLNFVSFYETFELMSYKRGWRSASECTTAEAKSYSATLLSEVLVLKKDYQIGNSKIFLKSDAYENMHLAVATFLGLKVRKFQALIRKRQQKRRYGVAKRGIVKAQAQVRRRIQRKKFKRLLAAHREEKRREAERLAAELQRNHALREKLEKEEQARLEAIRKAKEEAEEAQRKAKEEADAKRAAYEKRISDLHTAARNGDLATVKAHLEVYPEDYEVRNPHANNSTVLQSAILSGNLDLIKFFWPTSDDLQTKDDLGNVAIHYVILSGKKTALDILRFFATISEVNYDQIREIQKGLEIMALHRNIIDRSSIKTTNRGSLLATGRPESVAGGGGGISDQVEEEEVKHPTAELKSGWLSKRGESQTWRKRWVVLTSEALMYFRNNKDKIPRDTLSFNTKNDLKIERDPKKATAIDIYVNHQSVQKKRDRISIMAESEQEMQIWLTLLKAAAGVEVQSLRPKSVGSSSANATTAGAGAAATAGGKLLLIANPNIRSVLFRQVNNARETLLHLLSQYDPATTATSSDSLTQDDVLQLAAWLIHNYCPIDQFNSKGLTPLQIAVQLGNEGLASLYAKQGANINNHMYGASNKRSTLDLTNDVQFQLTLKSSFSTFENRKNTFLPIPPRLRGYHYLSLDFTKLVIQQPEYFVDIAKGSNYFIKVSTFNANHLLVEAPQTSPAPIPREVIGDTQFIYFLETFHLQFPLDNLEDKSYIILELVEKVNNPSGKATAAGGGDSELRAWGKISLDRQSISSETIPLPLWTPPLNTSTQAHSTLETELIITKR